MFRFVAFGMFEGLGCVNISQGSDEGTPFERCSLQVGFGKRCASDTLKWVSVF